MKKTFLPSLLLFIVTFYSCQNKTSENPYLIVLSLDGFRWDYTDYVETPVLDSLMKVGVMAESLKPSFPTKTFPNHYTIATGLYPDHHGLVSNNFHAPDLGKKYSIRNRQAIEDGAFYGGEPIWVTAEKQNTKTATLFWVGSEAEIQGIRPSYWQLYNEKLSFEARIDTIARWLQLPEPARPHLIMWYYHEPDATEHDFGTTSRETLTMIKELDSCLGVYFTKMRQLPNFNQLNFIVTSDHGMTDLSEDRLILIDSFIDTADVEYMDGMNPNLNIKVKEGKLEKVYQELKNTPHLFVWKHDSVPSRLNYGTHIRTLDLCVVAYPGWAIATSWKKRIGMATHGFDNDFKDMHAIFYAAGPAFKKGFIQPTFENVNIYPLMAEIMEIIPVSTDGKLENVQSMLRKN